ncbi:hypothetical protein Peur_035390 [Populus x canadensis]
MTSPFLSLKKACKALAFAQDLWLQQLNSSAVPSVSSFLNRSPFHPSHRSFTNIKPVIFSSDSAAPGPSYWISMNAIFVDEAASSSNKVSLASTFSSFKNFIIKSYGIKGCVSFYRI